MAVEFWTIAPVLDTTQNGKSKHYGDIREGLMIPPVRLGRRKKGYPRHEVQAINAARLRGASDEEIRQLVRQLIEQRRAAA
jgi:prophage regulatory protein